MGNRWLGFPTLPTNQNNVSILNCFALFYDFTANPKKDYTLMFFWSEIFFCAALQNVC